MVAGLACLGMALVDRTCPPSSFTQDTIGFIQLPRGLALDAELPLRIEAVRLHSSVSPSKPLPALGLRLERGSGFTLVASFKEMGNFLHLNTSAFRLYQTCRPQGYK